MDNIVVIGGGGHAKVLISILLKLNKYNVVGYVDPEDKGVILNRPFLGNDSVLEELHKEKKVNFAVLGVGSIGNGSKRLKLISRIKNIGFNFPPIISSDAVVAEDVSMGEGTVVMDGVIINTGTRVGNFSIFNTKVSVDHDCQIGNSVHFSPGVTICGGVTIEDNTFIGAGATVIQSIGITKDCLIGAGALVIKDCNKRGLYIGIPARKIL